MSLTLAFLAASAFATPQAVTPDQQHEKFKELALHHLIENAPAGERIHVDLVFQTQLDFEQVKLELGPMADKDLPRALRDRALEIYTPEQAATLQLLRNYEEQGLADMIAPLWIGNAIGVRTTADVILELASIEEIAYIHYDPPRPATLLGTTTGGNPTCDQETINSPFAWNRMNATGQGMVVAVIDTGSCYNHSDIHNNVWVNPGEDLGGDGTVWDPADQNGIDDDGNGYVDDLIGWAFDHTTSVRNDPMDHQIHGTHTAGTVVGDGTGGTQTGVAPGAKLMPIRTSTLISHEIEVWQSMEYAAVMDADVISMSLGWAHAWGPDRAFWRTSCNNTQTMGTMMVIAAGNEGNWSTLDNVRTPGDVPSITSVGATDCNDAAASFSSVGPVEWATVAGFNDFPFPPGLIKPNISAPGVNTVSTLSCSGYTALSGTSMATPHVAGVAAIIRSLRPDLSIKQVREALMSTAVDLGVPGKDNQYGAGRVDVQALLDSFAPLRADVYDVSASAGATVPLTLEASAARAGQAYRVLASASGNEPGILFASGLVLPLNQDAVYGISISLTNSPAFANSRGLLDASGMATTTVTIAPASLPAGSIGQVLSFAYATVAAGAVDYTSNPVNLSIQP
ncbi:MAG: S8 family serine peptidase [Planctomycetota bacterium]|nr:S8 family serine peptidase [Planctomycetota bacterium]